MKNRSSNGYIDIQINGYAGCDFNDSQSSHHSWEVTCDRLVADGVQGFLATIITDELDAMAARLSHLVKIRDQIPWVRDLMWGIHIEGPFINPMPGFVGAHPPHAVRPANLDDMRRLLDAADGLVRLVTLAPECDYQLHVTSWLAKQGVVVAAGHCDPSIDKLNEAIDAGLTMFTHLGNACPTQLHRHDNIIQRVLSIADRLLISFIADGIHIPFPALKNCLKCATLERSLIVTDAITAAGLGPGKYRLGPCSVEVDDSLAAWAPDRSHLVGSAATMTRVVQNLREHLGLSDAEIQTLTHDNPLKAIGLTHGAPVMPRTLSCTEERG